MGACVMEGLTGDLDTWGVSLVRKDRWGTRSITSRIARTDGGSVPRCSCILPVFCPGTHKLHDKPNSHSVSLVHASLKPRPRHSFQAVVGWRARGLRAPAQPRRLSAWPACNHEVVLRSAHLPALAGRASRTHAKRAPRLQVLVADTSVADTSGSGGQPKKRAKTAKKPAAKKKVASGHRQWPSTVATGHVGRWFGQPITVRA